MRLSFLPIWYISRQHCLKQYFVIDEANNPPGLSKTKLALEFPEQITLRKWQHLYTWSGLWIFKVMNTESHNSSFCIFSFPLPLEPHPSYLTLKKKKSTVSLENTVAFRQSHQPPSFEFQTSAKLEYVFYSLSILIPSITIFVPPGIPESNIFMLPRTHCWRYHFGLFPLHPCNSKLYHYPPLTTSYHVFYSFGYATELLCTKFWNINKRWFGMVQNIIRKVKASVL